MSHRIKNVTLEDGFAHNPNRIYHEEFFCTLPHQHKEFNLPSSAGNTDFTIYQPANSFLKELYVVCTSAPTITDGNVGISVSHGSTAQNVGSGTLVVGTETNIIQSHTTMAENTIAKVFPNSEQTSSSNAVETSIGYTTTRRILSCRVTTSTDASTVGTFKLIPVFGNFNTSLHQFNPIYTLTGTGTPYADFIDVDNSNYVYGGMYLFTSAASADDQVILHPNPSNGHNALNSGVLKTGSRIEFQTSVIFPSIATNFSFFAGLKLTATPLIATDNHQAMFCFGQASPLDASLPSTTNFVFAYSVGGTDYMTNLGLPVVADREYHLKFVMDKNRKIKVFINGVQFGLSSTSGTYTATNNYDESAQLTNNVSLYPMAGLQLTSATKRSVVVNYISCSRDAKKVST